MDGISLGHRKRLMAALRQQPTQDATPNAAEVAPPCGQGHTNFAHMVSPSCRLQAFSQCCNVVVPQKKLNRSQSVDVTLENNSTNPPTVPDRPAQKSRKSLHVSRSTRSNSDASELQLRPPNSSAITRWRHRPEVLVKGCCNYLAQVRDLIIF